MREKMVENMGRTVELTDEDIINIKKWLTATSMMIQAKLRTPYSESELKTSQKLTDGMNVKKIEQVLSGLPRPNKQKTRNSFHLSLKQRLILRINGAVFLRYEKREGWRDYLPIYLCKCSVHGYYETYPQGYEGRLNCPYCFQEYVAEAKAK